MNDHKGHRQRLKNRFLKDGIDSFADHEVLELLLFYGISRTNTNVIAHRLVERFGDLDGVLNADVSELSKVEGIGDHSAALIKLAAAIAGRYIMKRANENGMLFEVSRMGDYFVGRFFGESSEKLYLLLLDAKGRLVSEHCILEGSINSVGAPINLIVSKAIKSNSSNVVLAHNHPSGTVRPSDQDRDTTARLKYLLEQSGIKLVEHFVISGTLYCPIINSEIYQKEI